MEAESIKNKEVKNEEVNAKNTAIADIEVDQVPVVDDLVKVKDMDIVAKLVKKVPNLPTFSRRQWEETEYYDPDPEKWGLAGKARKNGDKIYDKIYPDDGVLNDDRVPKELKDEITKHKTRDLPTKLLEISLKGQKEELKVVERKSLGKEEVAYAVLSYNWGREKETERKIERFRKDLKENENWKNIEQGKEKLEELINSWKGKKDWEDSKDKDSLIEEIKKIKIKENYSSFFFSGQQYGKYKIENFNQKEIEEKSPAFAKTLLKVVEACRFLGIKYLWVDQLCVDQDNNEEKNREVKQMSKYYRNGAVTLVAIHKNISEKKIARLDPVLAIEKIINSSWFQRSWTFQEGWLSKRTVFMFDDVLVDGGYLAQVWAYNQAADVGGRYNSRQEFEEKTIKIATPIGWVGYKDGYKVEDHLNFHFRLHEALRGIRDRKRAAPIDGVYSILGLLPYEVEPDYEGEGKKGVEGLRKALFRVMQKATEEGYLEHLSWHGPVNDWIPKLNEDGSTEIWGGMNIGCEKGLVRFVKGDTDDTDTLLLVLNKSKKYSVEGGTEDITKIGGDSVIGGIYSGTVKLKETEKEGVKIWGTEKALESVKGGDFLVVPDNSELWSGSEKPKTLNTPGETPFGILVRKSEKEVSGKLKYLKYSRIGLVELKDKDWEELKKGGSDGEITISLGIQSEENKGINKREEKDEDRKKVFLGGTCGNSTWRKELIPKLKIGYFDPMVGDWNEKAQEDEIRQREACDFLLYVITREMEGFYAITEVVADSIKRPQKTIFCYLKEGFSKHQIESLKATERLVRENGAKIFTSLGEIAKYLNEETETKVFNEKTKLESQHQAQIEVLPK